MSDFKVPREIYNKYVKSEKRRKKRYKLLTEQKRGHLLLNLSFLSLFVILALVFVFHWAFLFLYFIPGKFIYEAGYDDFFGTIDRKNSKANADNYYPFQNITFEQWFVQNYNLAQKDDNLTIEDNDPFVSVELDEKFHETAQQIIDDKFESDADEGHLDLVEPITRETPKKQGRFNS